MDPVYLDYNATTPIDPLVAEAMLPFIFDHFGNPSSGHVYGQRARAAVEDARHAVANLLGCHSGQVELSSVLEAMRVPLEYAKGTVRLSVGRTTTTEEIDRAVAEIVRVVGAHAPAAGS